MGRPNVAERHGYAASSFRAGGRDHVVYRGGDGPTILLLHEMPSFSWRTVKLADHLRAEGFRIVMPILVGRIRDAPVRGLAGGIELAVDFTATLTRICISREFVALLQNRTSPVADWIRALARSEAAAAGVDRVGVIGMCFSGGFALAAAIDPVVGVAVVSQPALPFAVGPLKLIPGQSRDIGLSPRDRASLAARREDPDLCVRAFRYSTDRLVPAARVARIAEELGSAATLTEIPATRPAHSVLTDATDVGPDPSAGPSLQAALDSLVATLHERLDG
jgi:dienelactone hydrolase